MHRKTLFIVSLALGLCIGLAFSVVFFSSVSATNTGTLEDPVVIAADALPFSEYADTTNATVGPSDPVPDCASGWPRDVTRWYAFTPAEGMTVKTTAYGVYNTNVSLAVYQYSSEGSSLEQVGCSGSPSGYVLALSGGQTYYFMISAQSWDPWPYAAPSYYPPYPSQGEQLYFSMEQFVPPANDAFAGAESITSLPAYVNAEMQFATMEPSEPKPSCSQGWSEKSVWYRFTPDTTAEMMASVYGSIYLGVYTGTSLDNLSEVACGASYQTIAFKAQAGTTYFIQLAQEDLYWQTSAVFYLAVAPDPYFYYLGYSPYDPSTYDNVQFYTDANDPAGTWPLSYQWDFGDGTTATANYPSHRYAADGDYTVSATVTTSDGRSASRTETVHVRTHDVSITGMKAPDQVKAGQKHRFVVTLQSNRYPESVQVDLYKKYQNNRTLVGSLVQDVPAGKPVDFTFDYLFSESDETQPFVGFEAEATIINARDAVPGDNQFIVAIKGSILKNWTAYAGGWGIVDGKLTTLNENNPWQWQYDVWAGSPAIVFEGDLTASFNISMSLTNNSYGGVKGGVLFYASAPTQTGWEFSGYSIEWNSDFGEGVRLLRWDNGYATHLVASSMYQLQSPPKQWVIQVQGKTIYFYGDGVLIFSVEDDTYRSGYFGFWSYGANTKLEVSDVIIGKKFKALIH